MRYLLAAALALGALCCGPKSKPPVIVEHLCPDSKPEVCEIDDIGPFNCVCPE